ncbi:dihydrolipoyl dehydrogenase family protein [Tautonia plasticadhaerens]|uniref:Mercuric reductase n=1 Tax=Tautonia plasticadhaerens TaxID=2527974 RepID=A0A518GYK4_9BACT|nr:NAD(P)/FAD-dependent oxidoreductase [Tautonia plasticadhaerens]QDV33680.1 Mercuric reductase [Tautonia plasticadhaerens]
MYDLVVLGGGSGGLNVAGAAAAVGAKVALIEADRLGGECTFTACVPSKALLHAADLARRIRQADRYGLGVPPPEVDFAAVMDRVRGVVASFAGSDVEAMRARGVHVIFGRAAFEAYDTVLVDGSTRVNGRAFVIATGSRPSLPPIEGLEAAGPLTNETFWTLNARPESLAIIGAGAVGVELGQAMARLGVEVTLIESAPRILSGEDPEVGDRLRPELEAEGITIFTDAEIAKVEQRDGKKVVHFSDRSTGEAFEAGRDALLVAAGRRANLEGLNLGAIGIEADPAEGIPVDAYLQTYARNVYAIGDVIGHHQWTHAAEREAAVAFQNAVLRIPKKVDYSAMPHATFSDPEVAEVGRTHGFEPGERARIFRVEYEEVDRARIEGRTHGFAKVAVDRSGTILGATIMGDNAALVLQEFVVAMENGLTLKHLLNTVHPYPTHAGLARALATRFAATRLESGAARAALRLVYGYHPDRPDPSPSPASGDGAGGG